MVTLLIHEFPHWARDLEVIRLEWEASASDAFNQRRSKRKKGNPLDETGAYKRKPIPSLERRH